MKKIEFSAFLCTSWDALMTCLGGHLLNMLEYVSVFHILESFKLNTEKKEGRITCPGFLVTLLLVKKGICLTLLIAK